METFKLGVTFKHNLLCVYMRRLGFECRFWYMCIFYKGGNLYYAREKRFLCKSPKSKVPPLCKTGIFENTLNNLSACESFFMQGLKGSNYLFEQSERPSLCVLFTLSVSQITALSSTSRHGSSIVAFPSSNV